MWVETCWPVHSSIASLMGSSLAPRSAAEATAPPPRQAARMALAPHKILFRFIELTPYLVLSGPRFDAGDPFGNRCSPRIPSGPCPPPGKRVSPEWTQPSPVSLAAHGAFSHLPGKARARLL